MLYACRLPQVAQICASLMDPDEFVATVMFRHGAADEPLVSECEREGISVRD